MFDQPTTSVLPSGEGPVDMFAKETLMPTAASFAGFTAAELLSPLELEAVAAAAEPVADALAMIELASWPLIVVVLVDALSAAELEPELDEPDEPDEESDEELEELLLEETEDERLSWARDSVLLSMKAMRGPATSWVVARSRTLFARAWSSLVTKMATGPLMPSGTTHSLKGREMEKAAPPTIMLQKRPSVEPLMAEDENSSLVPIATVPVLVRASDGFAGTPRSQPEMKPPAMARTSDGVKGMSNAEGMTDAEPARMLSTVWWRASTVRIEPAAVRRTGSEIRLAAPR